MFWWLMLVLSLGAIVVGYVAYVQIRDGTQPGEPFIDRFLQRIKMDRGEPPPATPGPTPEAGIPQAEVDRRIATAVQLAIEDTLRRVAQTNLQGPH